MKLLAAIFPLLLLPLDALAGSCPAAPVQIENAIRQHITRLGATEYCDARRVKTENGITVAIYTAEGVCAGQNSHDEPGTCSNNWVRYIIWWIPNYPKPQSAVENGLREVLTDQVTHAIPRMPMICGVPPNGPGNRQGFAGCFLGTSVGG